MKEHSNHGLLSVSEFLRFASIGRTKFYQEVAAGRLRLRKIGTKSVVSLPDALAWVESLPTAGDANRHQ